MIKSILKFPFYLIWYAALKPILTVLSIPFLIIIYIIISIILGLSYVWERARYGDPERYQNLGCD